MEGPDRDELDRLLARSAPAPPAGLQALLLRRAAVSRRAGRLTLALAGDGAALLGLGLLSLLLIRSMESTGGLELLRLAVADRSLVQRYPGEYATAVMQAVPWHLVATQALDLLAVVLLTRYLVHAAEPPSGGRLRS